MSCIIPSNIIRLDSSLVSSPLVSLQARINPFSAFLNSISMIIPSTYCIFKFLFYAHICYHSYAGLLAIFTY
ncbi:hypothetical protein K493DRAFT_4860 [Basidiobolus meristosporus CBS 931.73]|uniref:Uncharacterized protein n=1 Tax=Basidiobolus meristosporus CBS 931.73 TaxID=1314790 RepID=A0A1Y1YL72_9FUNG|nr:hypothetical protein K493DRAFT_4860 [Basidiobolus meristosporus CBS 931.73]|eukprot:ORX98742.1 hypothetical protein K493DRAFT_4860 [Basidiobolus meristosporus CBS 931.73]